MKHMRGRRERDDMFIKGAFRGERHHHRAPTPYPPAKVRRAANVRRAAKVRRAASRITTTNRPTEPDRAEPSRAEPSRAEPSRAEPRRAEPSRAEPSRAEPSRSESKELTFPSSCRWRPPKGTIPSRTTGTASPRWSVVCRRLRGRSSSTARRLSRCPYPCRHHHPW